MGGRWLLTSRHEVQGECVPQTRCTPCPDGQHLKIFKKINLLLSALIVVKFTRKHLLQINGKFPRKESTLLS